MKWLRLGLLQKRPFVDQPWLFTYSSADVFLIQKIIKIFVPSGALRPLCWVRGDESGPIRSFESAEAFTREILMCACSDNIRACRNVLLDTMCCFVIDFLTILWTGITNSIGHCLHPPPPPWAGTWNVGLLDFMFLGQTLNSAVVSTHFVWSKVPWNK